jgi:hypothetical protein
MAQLVDGLAKYVALQMMVLLDQRTAFGGDMRGRTGQEFMSLFQLATGGHSYNAKVARLTGLPLEVDLDVHSSRLLPAARVADQMIATYDAVQTLRQQPSARPNAEQIYALLRDALVEVQGPAPERGSWQAAEVAGAINQAAYALSMIDELRRSDDQ